MVGINAWVVHRDHTVFGADAESWRPERWLCERAERKRMEDTLLTVCSLPENPAWIMADGV